ncbi:polyketide synthase [Nemania abortiva]|nr:polyketide synthase [Nemania abortiva]
MAIDCNDKEPIAIVGMGCRLPGHVHDIPALWELLRDQKDVHTEFVEPRFSSKGYYHPNSERAGTAVASGGFLLEEDPRLFDPAFFGITDLEAETLDASQRKLLEVTYEAFENAGETWESVSGTKTGVFVGDICFDNYLTQTRDWDYSNKYAATGSFPNMLANRIHYVFNLKGPSLLVNSACTSAMYALHLAVTSMRNGDCDSAIVAGSNWIMDPNCHIAMGKLGALSPSSRSHTFDASADGYARGEGFVALYLKKVTQAVRDASPIRALVMGTAVNANGRTSGITNPSAPAQEVVIREAYKNAGGLDPSQTMFLECHGTGTRVGDPTEVSAAGRVFGASRSSAFEDRLVVGSVKTNLGHLEGACAFPGILKVVTSLEAGIIPPTLRFKTANPRIDFEAAKARVSTELEPWPKNKVKRGSVTSAGFGGTNGHCILDHVHEYLPGYIKPGIVSQHIRQPSATNGTNATSIQNGTNGHNGSVTAVRRHDPVTEPLTLVRSAHAGTRQFVLVPLSAHNQASLAANIDVLSRALSQHSLADVAYTLAAKRSRFQNRTYCVINVDEATPLSKEAQAKVYSSPQPVRVGFIFTGQGAQWDAMGAQLFEYAVFRDTIAYLDSILATLPEPAPWRLVDILSGHCETNLVQKPTVSQTACTALQIGLVDLLASWSIRPRGVAGHSSGEMAAAYAAGRITAAEAITTAYYRGYIVGFNKKEGAMLAVGLSPEKGSECISAMGLEGRVSIAAMNSSDSITISGDADAIERLSGKLSQDSIFNRVLRTSGLSHHMLALGHDYSKTLQGGLQQLDKLDVSTGKYLNVPWVSSVTPNKDIPTIDGHVAVSYWRSNLESPVRFAEAVSNLLGDEELGIGALIELGPHPALRSPLNNIAKALGKTVPHVATLKRGEDARKSLVDLAGTLFALNAEVDLVAVNAIDGDTSQGSRALTHGTTAVDLPPYQYQYGPVKYNESRISRDYRLRSVPRHDLLGAKVPGTTRFSPQWRNILSLKNLPWLNDHRVPPHVLHPGAAHIVMCMVAAEQAYQEFPDALPITGFILRNISIKKTLVVPQDDQGIEIVLSMDLDDGATAIAPGWGRFTIASVVRGSEQWTEHCSGSVKVAVSKFEQPDPIDTTMDGRVVSEHAWYTRFADMGLQFGPSFQGYSDIRADPSKNLATASLLLNTTKGLFPGGESPYPIHPASLDLLIRLGLIACNGGQVDTASVQLPIHLNEMKFTHGHLHGRNSATGVSSGAMRGLRGAYAHLQLLSETGDVILDVDNMRFTSLNNDQQSGSDKSQSSDTFASPFGRLVWRPDIRTMSAAQLQAQFSTPLEGPISKVSSILDLMGHANPNLRVLELNAGSDNGAARAILTALTGPNGIKNYAQYDMTDISEERLGPVREETSKFRDVGYSVLATTDATKIAGKGTYDVVVVVLDGKDPSSTHEALESSHALLKPAGSVVLLVSASRRTGIQGWTEALETAGFAPGAKLVTDESPKLRAPWTVILSTSSHKTTQVVGSTGPVYLIHGLKGAPALVNHVAQALQERGLTTQTMPMDSVQRGLGPNSRVVAFLDGENLLLDADQNRLGLFQHLAANSATMVWITSCGLVKGRNPDGAVVTGLLRTLGSENPAAQFLSIDIDAEDFQVSSDDLKELIRCLVEQELALQKGLGESDGGAVNRELVWQDGSLWVSRIVPDASLEGYAKATLDDRDVQLVKLDELGPVRAAFGAPGILTSLYFRPYTELWQPLADDFIEVEIEAVGLNWKDLGLCSGRFDQNNLSNEYCGIVVKKGNSVSQLQIGDRVYGMGKGHFGNFTRVPAALAQKVAPGVDPIDAATMPLVYMTAVYAFEHITRLRKGQNVLIQSASGGLGLAAIQLARSKGAEVFVTAGTAEKSRFLIEEIGIPSSRVFSSRNVADIPRMVETTQNGGFDVILSTAQGDLLYESIKALAPLGHLIDVGRLDVTSSQSMALELFQKSASFTSFDLGLVVDRSPALGAELMLAVSKHHRAKRIGAVQPCTVSDISQLDQTLLRFSKGTHIGKMVISYQNPDSFLKVHQTAAPVHFDPEASYILVGGLSGLGRTIVRWMAERGARNLIIWSRSGSNGLTSHAKSLRRDMAAKGISIQLVTCDVSDREQVNRAVQEAASKSTVRGVFNFAVSYQDISFDKMTEDMFHKGMAAKVLGTKNLHEATAQLPLDFFVMTSSLGTVYAFPTQSTYLAANNFLDYFARFRQRQGLPASTISLGFISDLGQLTEDAVTVNLFVRAKGQTVTGSQVLRAIEPAFRSARRQTPDAQAQWVGRAQDPLSEANIISGIDPAVLVLMRRDEAKKTKSGSGSGAAPRWYHDARSSHMLHALEDAWRELTGEGSGRSAQGWENAADKSPAALLRQRFEMSVRKLRSGGNEDEKVKIAAFVTSAIQSSVAEMLFVDPTGVSPAKTVADHGIDSLLAAEFRNWLHVAFGKNISMLDLMDAKTSINALAATIVQEALS